ARRRGDEEKRVLTPRLARLGGLLPRAVKRRWGGVSGAPAITMTISSAAPLFVVGFLGLVGVLVGMVGAPLPLPGWLAPPAPIAAYLFLESAARLMSAVASEEPLGNLAVEIVYALDRAARRSSGAGR